MLEDGRDKKGTNIYRMFFAIIVLGGKKITAFVRKEIFCHRRKLKRMARHFPGIDSALC